ARALYGRSAFAQTRPCSGPHSVEVYKAVAMSDVQPQVADYGQLLEPQTAAYQELALQVDRACMNQTLFNVANATGINNAVVAPAFPDGVTLGWAPPSPQQWAAGQRVFACTLTQKSPSALLYSTVFSGSFPTEDRTCIDNRALEYVDCARQHNRERIGLIDLRAAVGTGQVPGPASIKNGTVPVSAVLYQALDRACTTYLKQISDTTRLTGVAEIDADQWPTPTGTYPVACEADTAPAKPVITTEGSVFDR
ncbi:MAG TPA: septum formation family protein, partial [Marmoricola sp.]|nr:septum formation family protein [Marmoricola sp.]